MHTKSKYKETTIGCVSTTVLILIYRRWCHQRNCRNSVEPAENSRTRIHNYMPSSLFAVMFLEKEQQICSAGLKKNIFQLNHK